MSVLFKNSNFDAISSKELAQQIEGRKKCQKKLPTWFNTPKIYYPKKVNIEQTSSEITAQYKRDIVSGKSLVDLTGGFGVDSYFFSQKIDTVFHCELDSELTKIATHNFDLLGAKNIRVLSQDGISFLQNSKQQFDWIFIDPSRRNNSKGKVFLLADCKPDVTKHLDLFFNKTKNILLKTSPLLDITSGIKSLRNAKEIHVVAVNNEVKELLWVLKKDYKNEIKITTTNITKPKNERFDFVLSDENKALAQLALPQKYIYEPNAAILKSGAFKAIGQQYQVFKLHQNTHLYTSQTLIDWPGRSFKILNVLPYNKKILKNLELQKANITVRNFPESVATIRKKFKIIDGGNTYLFFFKNCKEHYQILICSKVNI